MTQSVIVAGARTPIGRLLGGLKTLSGTDLGGIAIKGALEKAGITGDQVDYVIMGQVLGAGAGQVPARQAAFKGGIPLDVPALTINKVCLSGINAIALADQLIRAGEYDVVVAGGQESMTQAPHLLQGSREGTKYGKTTLLDHMEYDGLWDALTDQAMGALTEQRNADLDAFTREEQDAFGARSHQLAATAQKNGVFDEEIVPVEIPQRKGDPVVVSADEGVRGDTTAESLGRLRPAFSKDGTITAGTASQISDGAAAVVVMSKAKAEEMGLMAPMVGHVGDGNFHALLLIDMENAEERAKADEYVGWLNDLAISMEGTCTGEHGIGQGKRPYLVRELGETTRFMAAVKAALDPDNILNPGKILSDG